MTARFLSPLDLRAIDGTDEEWVVIAPFRWYSSRLGREFEVEPGFVTDLESVPRWIPFAYAFAKGRARWAAVIHDWLYRRRGRLPDGTLLTREECDLIFLELMKEACRLPSWRRYPMFWAVRSGGSWTWPDPPTLVDAGIDQAP